MFLQPIKMRRLAIYISRDNIKQILYQLGQAKLIQFINLNENVNSDSLPYNRELMWFERVRSKVNVLFNMLNEHDIKYMKNADIYNSGIFNSDEIENHYTRLQELKGMRTSVQDKLLRLKENYLILEELKEHNISMNTCLSGIIEIEKMSVLKRVLETVLRNNLVIHTRTVDYSSTLHDQNFPKSNIPSSILDEMQNSLISKLSNKMVFIIFAYGEETITRIKKICTSFNARILQIREIEPSTDDEDFRSEESSKEEDSPQLVDDHSYTHSEILKITSLIQQYHLIYYHNCQTIHHNLTIISQKIHSWQSFINISIKIIKTMNYLKEENSFYGQAFVPESEIVRFKKVISKICKGSGRIAYEDVDSNKRIRVVFGNNQSESEMGYNENSEENFKGGNDENDSHDNKFDSNKENAVEESNPNDNINIHNTTTPTYFILNTFNKPFQEMNDVYGVPDYKEINPTLFTMITFPLLFGSMFGDVGHGLILLIISILLIKKPFIRKYHEMIGLLVNGRYMLLVCSIYSIYFGILYSEFFGISISVFKYKNINLIGFDPNYHHMKEGLNILNSLKMKISILIGTLHMFIGLIINSMNCYLLNDKISFICKTLPKILCFISFCGYLSLLVIVKFIRPFNYSIINIIVNMYTDPFNSSSYFYNNQFYVQLFLLCMFIVCIPWMMCSYPIYLIMKKSKRGRKARVIETEQVTRNKNIIEDDEEIVGEDVKIDEEIGNNEEIVDEGVEKNEEEMGIIVKRRGTTIKEGVSENAKQKDFPKKGSAIENKQLINNKMNNKSNKQVNKSSVNLTDTIIHIGIDTIEFTIGLISNISSYLRIWAVSLAHSQLTIILHSYTLGQTNFLLRIITFPGWFIATMALMIMLEGLSSSLHAMRLNWIEFNSKFYKGGGCAFKPLCFDEDSEE